EHLDERGRNNGHSWSHAVDLILEARRSDIAGEDTDPQASRGVVLWDAGGHTRLPIISSHLTFEIKGKRLHIEGIVRVREEIGSPNGKPSVCNGTCDVKVSPTWLAEDTTI